jgi:predicted nuclease of predicted toxin-antitoxin system
VIRVVIDMNLGPPWVDALSRGGVDAVHWSTVGAMTAPDAVIFAWAAANNRIILTCDLDFPQILALGGAGRPSVVVLRAQDPSASVMGKHVLTALKQNEDALQQGALVMVDATRNRVRILPLQRT